MLPMLNNCRLPLCLSGISHRPLAVYKEMADHERRREAMKKMKFQENLRIRSSDRYHQVVMTITSQNKEALILGIDGGEGDGEDHLINDFPPRVISQPRTAKAA